MADEQDTSGDAARSGSGGHPFKSRALDALTIADLVISSVNPLAVPCPRPALPQPTKDSVRISQPCPSPASPIESVDDLVSQLADNRERDLEATRARAMEFALQDRRPIPEIPDPESKRSPSRRNRSER